MKTLMIVTGGLGTGGLERISCCVANKFANKGWKVVILTLLQKEGTGKSFQFLKDGIDVINFNGNFDPILHKYRAIKFWKKMIKNSTKRYHPDSILAMTFKIASLVCLFAPKYACKITIREISDPKSKVRNPFVNKITEFLCRKTKNIIFQTQWEKQCFNKKIQSKGIVIPNPLSIKNDLRGKFKEKKIFTLTRLLINQKRQDILIKGFELFHDKHPDYCLEIYGKGEDKNTINELIKNSKCKEFIKIFNPEPNIHDKIINYRCFVITSDFEGMSNALLECYSLGIPCISSDWPGVEDIITHGEDGLIYKRQVIELLSNLLCEVAENDDLCERLTKKARTRAYRFDENKIIEKYCEAIESE